MADVTLVDLVKITASTTGTGAVTLGSPVPGYRGVEALLNGAIYSYAIQQEAEYEVGTGTYLADGNQFIRTPGVSSDGGTAIDLQPNAAIAFVATAQDILGRDVLRPLYGYGEPLNNTGIVGQTYTDLTKPVTLYGPKTSFGWGIGVVLSGGDGDKGATGASDATFLTLNDLKSIDPEAFPSPRLAAESGSSDGVTNGPFIYQAGNFAGRTDVVKLNTVPLEQGALVRPLADTLVSQGRAAGIIRSQQQINNEGLTLRKDFGAIDGASAATNTSRLKMAIADCAPNGITLRDLGGTYTINDTLGGPTDGKIAVFNGLTGRGFQFICAGRAGTIIRNEGDNTKPALHLIGNMPNLDMLTVRGLTIAPPADPGPNGTGTAAGIRLENMSGFSLRDYYGFRLGCALELIGCLNGDITSVLLRYCRQDMNMTKGSYLSNCNTIRISDYRSLAAYERAIVNVGGALLNVQDFGIEGLGAENPNPGAVIGFAVSGMGLDGGIGLTTKLGYFEAYKGTPIYITAGDNTVSYEIANSFNRIGSNAGINSEIVFDGNGLTAGAKSQKLDINGSSFPLFQDYAPTQQNPRPFVQAVVGTGYTGLTLIDKETLYPIGSNEMPSISSTIRRLGRSATEVYGTIDESGNLSNTQGISAGRWKETGFAEFTFTRGISGLRVYGFSPKGVAASIFEAGPGDGPNTLVFATQRANGSFSNTTFSFVASYSN